MVLVLVNMVLKILLDRWLDSNSTGYIRAHSSMITMSLSSIITVIIINSFREVVQFAPGAWTRTRWTRTFLLQFYRSASVILTKIENPRTQCDFDNSVLYKRYLLGFMNNYVPTFYEAFFKVCSKQIGVKKVYKWISAIVKNCISSK